eukprot:Partr_v1_DN24137_c1_g1_i1_m71223 putative signal peptidase
MHNFYQRANAVFAYALSVSFAVAAVVTVLTPLLLIDFPAASMAGISISVPSSNLAFGRYDPHFNVKNRQEYGFINAELNADLSPLFNWNTKQLFLALVMTYSTDGYPVNEITIWDDIIFTPKQARFRQFDLENKYAITDIDARTFRGKNASLHLEWEVVPHFGMLQVMKSDKFPFTFPDKLNKE